MTKIDMTMDYHVWGAMLECYQRYTPKLDQHCRPEDCLVDNIEWFSAAVHWH